MIRTPLILTMLFPAFPAVAQQAQSTEPVSTTQAPDTGRKRHVKVFLGFRTDGATDFTLGGEFSRRQGQRFSFGAFAEMIFADDLAFLLGGVVQFHTRGRLYFETGPGFAFDGGSDFFWRAGVGYELSPVGLTIAPKLYLDFVSGETLLGYGILLGRRF
jgi:hypothetical protein